MIVDPVRALALRFEQRFGGTPHIFSAPGRVNLIGEHTDYNAGFVMPAALPFCARVAVGPATRRRITVHSENLDQTASFDLDEPSPGPEHTWSDYVRGVAILLDQTDGGIRGANLALTSGVPMGAGLSSSAALEIAAAFALLSNSERVMDRVDIALLCQRAENEFVGARCGIMDQFTACTAQADEAILLDCRSLESRQILIPKNIRLLVCNTMVKHALAASGEYNRRRAECEAGVRVLSRWILGVKALRDVTAEQLAHHASQLDPVIYRRCRHVVTENLRVLAAAHALEHADLNEFGRWMTCSHRSLRDDYEVSSPELDTMVELASRVRGVYGSRMTGGGFGGCTISLVEAEQAESAAELIRREYLAQTGIHCETYICSASDGAREETV
jgi:galactokinase